ncbi:hypothetical protein KKD19_03055 [Patescibacteria group bacterium]|nr:hypothetical protein [Patescibacteria group bacterium]MBU4512194.1 hypothetical protein [Patescibacteria group bacterium]
MANKAQKLWRRIYNLLKLENYEIDFDTNPSRQGIIEPSDKIIYINPKWDILLTLIHECLHLLHPEWSEGMVEKKEKLVCESLSKDQWRHLFILMANSFRISIYNRPTVTKQ